MSDAITGGRQASLSIPRAAQAVGMIVFLIVFSVLDTAAAPPLAGFNPASLPFTPNGPFVEASAFAADTVLPAQGIIDDSWRGRFTPRDHNTADVYWNAATGVVANGWRVAAFNRAEGLIESNRDAIEFIYLTKKKKDLQTDHVYQADIGISGYIASGVEVSHGRKLDALVPGLSAGVTARYLAPHYLQDGTMNGYVIPQGPRRYSFNLFLDYAYDSNIVYNRKDENPGDGYGYGADAGVSYSRGGWRAAALVRNILGTIWWDRAPFTTAEAVTPGTSTTEDGYQRFIPSIRGYEGHKRYRQKVPRKTDLSLGYQYRDVSGTANVFLIEDRTRTWLEAGYRLNEEVRFTLGYNPDYYATSYGVAAYGFTLGFTLEGFRIKDSRALGLQASYLYRW